MSNQPSADVACMLGQIDEPLMQEAQAIYDGLIAAMQKLEGGVTGLAVLEALSLLIAQASAGLGEERQKVFLDYLRFRSVQISKTIPVENLTQHMIVQGSA